MAGPDPAVAAVRGAVRAALADVDPGARVLVACSGGADSLALAAATAFVAARSGLGAGAVIVDHGWHDGSAEVAARAGRACRGFGLDPVDVVRVDAAGGPGLGGPEAVARTARYAALDEAADRHAAAVVLLGHTLDDQAESVLLGLARGSGARSLAGMAAVRGRLRRPLLGLPRATTAAACAALGLDPWPDPSNTDPAYTRVRVRQALAVLGDALGPDLPTALARTADLLRQDADALDDAAGELLRRARVEDGWDVVVLAGAPPAVRRRALLAAARSAGSPAGALGRRHALAVDALVVAWHGQGAVHLPGRVVAVRACGTLRLSAADPLE